MSPIHQSIIKQRGCQTLPFIVRALCYESISTLGADGGTRTRTPFLALAPQASVSAIPPHPHRNATYLCTDGVANHRRLLIDCSCLNKHPTIVWARYLLRFFIFSQPFSAKPHIRDHRYCSAYASAGGSLVVIRVNGSMVRIERLELSLRGTWA